jgi:hypothetical protein
VAHEASIEREYAAWGALNLLALLELGHEPVPFRAGVRDIIATIARLPTAWLILDSHAAVLLLAKGVLLRKFPVAARVFRGARTLIRATVRPATIFAAKVLEISAAASCLAPWKGYAAIHWRMAATKGALAMTVHGHTTAVVIEMADAVAWINILVAIHVVEGCVWTHGGTVLVDTTGVIWAHLSPRLRHPR